MAFRVKTKGDWGKTKTFLEHAKDFDPMPILKRYGEIGVEELYLATPIDTGLTATSWYYEIEKTKDGYEISWNNRNVVDGVNIAIIIQYGHGTASGTYVQGRDYINPAMQQVFDDLAVQLWREVSE